MNTSTRVAGFVAGLAAVFALAFGAGGWWGPDGEPAPSSTHPGHAAEDHVTGAASGAVREAPEGLAVSQVGYTLRLAEPVAAAGDQVPVAFRITGPDGAAVQSFETGHERRLHLIAVRRDFTGFQHVHPELAPGGTWSTALDLTPGHWRLFADFQADGAAPMTLGSDLAVAGRFQPARHPGETRTASVGDYTVRLAGDLRDGADSRLTLTVARDGRPVTDLQPYLGAYGHLVALRSGDLAYVHVHPDGTPGDGDTPPGPHVVFHADAPSAGTYHLYLDFRHRGVVRTAGFTLSTSGAGQAAPSDDHSGAGHTHH